MTDRLGNQKLQTTLHLCRCHPSTLYKQSERQVHITTGKFSYILSSRRIQFIKKTEHPEHVRLRHTIFVKPHNLPFAETDREGLWPRSHIEFPGLFTQGEHF